MFRVWVAKYIFFYNNHYTIYISKQHIPVYNLYML